MPSKLLKGKHILAVDDEADVLDILSEELQDCEVLLDRASSYEEAVRRMASSVYDVVLTLWVLAAASSWNAP